MRTGPYAYTSATTYDHNGNRLTQTLNGQTDNYSYQANAYNSNLHTDELLRVSGGISGTKTFSYDANGTVRSENANGDTLTFNTDYEDKPLSITGTTPAGVSVSDTYAYNGLGMRQTGPGLNPLTDGETPGSPILVNEGITYTPGISRSGGPNGSLFYLTDGHDEVLGQTDSAWTLDDDIRYNPWGDQIKHGGSAPTGVTQGWGINAAYQQDGDTDLILMGSRYYDPSLGRFLSQDPAGDGDNWYAYADNDPLAEEDPTGLTDTPMPNVASMGGGDGDWIGALMGGSGYEGEGGGASFLYLTRWDWDKKAGQYSATWSVPLWGEDNEFDAAPDKGPYGFLHKKHWQSVAAAERKLYNTMQNDFGKHINAAHLQISDAHEHNRIMVEKFKRDYDHVQDLQNLIRSLNKGMKMLNDAGVQDSEEGRAAFGDVMKAAQDLLDYVAGAIGGFGI